MKITVLGANGFVGLSLCRHLATYKSIELCCFSRTISAALQELTQHDFVKIIQGDYFQKESLIPAIQGADIVFHLISSSVPSSSWEQPRVDIEQNLLPSIDVFSLCASLGVKKVVYTSSGGAVYGEAYGMSLDESHPAMPFSPYGISKIATEGYLRYFKKKSNLQYDIYRISNIYGKGVTKTGFGVINAWLWAAKKGDPIRVFGDGKNMKDYIYVDDVVKLMMNSLKNLNMSDTYNICSGNTASLNYILKTIQLVTGKTLNVKYEQTVASDNKTVSLSNKKILSVIDDDFTFISLEDGIRYVWQDILETSLV